MVTLTNTPRAIVLRVLGLTLAAATSMFAQTSYRTPPTDVVQIIDAPPPPIQRFNPGRDAMLTADWDAMPSLTLLARPFHRLAGIRIDGISGVRRQTGTFRGLSLIRFDDPQPLRIELPAGSAVDIPVWSPTGEHFAFKRYNEDEIELWVGETATGSARKVPGVRLNDILDESAFQWLPDGVSLLLRLVPGDRGPAPEPPLVPSGPIVDETSGRVAKLRTFQDLLKNPYEQKLFRHYAISQLAVFNTRTGTLKLLGLPDLYLDVSPSPNYEYYLVTRLNEPFSYRVPYFWFARTTEVWDRSARLLRQVADLPVSDDVPPQGVETGPRAIQWQPLMPATVLWIQALDDGDPIKKVPHRDALWAMDLTSPSAPKELLRVQHRLTNIRWFPSPGEVLITEYDRDRRWTVTAHLDFSNPEATRKVLFDISAQDDYRNPGTPLTHTRPDGQTVILRDNNFIYLAGQGATPSGPRPFLDRLNLETKHTERLFRSDDTSLEHPLTFLGDSREKILLQHQSPTAPPNLFIHDLKTAERQPLTSVADPAPQLTLAERKLLKYNRADGVQLSGMLYLPPGQTPGTRLPTVVWAYPLEYSDPATAGQIRSAPNAFAYFRGTSPLLFLTQGYAVLMNATMPVVGDPETMNETYVEQVTDAARAAVDILVESGVSDRDRVLVAGHSYGGFMTANLLAHSDLFAAGIARSGAYNRTLTPFGFQAERRSLWEAPHIYAQISPFMHANKINEPLLLIHGEADNNSGTFPMQSERLFQAIQGHGGTAKLVLLPHESHGYVARESVLHVLAEMFDWADRHVKNRSTAPGNVSLPNQGPPG